MKRSSIFIFAGICIGACFIHYASRSSRNAEPHSKPVFQTNSVSAARSAPFRDITGQSKIEALRIAIKKGDRREIAPAMDRLAQHTEEYPESFAGLLTALRLETEPAVLRALNRLVTEHWTVHREKMIVQTALEMSQSVEPAKRRLVVSLLSNASEITPALIQSLQQFQNDPENDIRLAAAATLNQWRSKFPESFEERKRFK